jgi:hypothetical protein
MSALLSVALKAANDVKMSKREHKSKNPLQKPKYFRQNKSLAGSKLVVVSVAPMKIRNQWRGSDEFSFIDMDILISIS